MIKGVEFMSQYLCFRKNNQELVSFSRNSAVYRAFDHLHYSENWKSLDDDDFKIAIGVLETNRDTYEEDVQLCEKAMEGLSYKDKLKCLRDIKELNEGLRCIERAIHYIDLLQMIAEEYDLDGNKHKMYYCIG
jgi:hypothetical protein